MTRARSLRKRLEHAAETFLAYLIYGFFRLLPLDAASWLGGKAGEAAGRWLFRSATRRADRNIARAMPEKTENDRKKIIRAMWNNLGRTAAEYPHLRRIWPRITLEGASHLAAARDSNAPAIFCSGHLANWEIAALGAKHIGLDIHLVYRKPNNPGVDGLLRHARNAGAASHIQKGTEGARAMLKILRENGALGVLIDQKLNEGLPIPFFGRDAMTAPAVAHFTYRFNCPLYPARIERLKGAWFKMTVYPALVMPDTGDKKTDIRQLLTTLNATLETWIRERPGQWLWIHRRWPD